MKIPTGVNLNFFEIITGIFASRRELKVHTSEEKSSPSFILKTVFKKEQGKKWIMLQVEAVICTSTDIHVLHYSGFWLGYAHLRCAHPSF
jgi:hypothetical protein